MLPCRLEQCFGLLNRLISKWSSETILLSHSSNHIFWNESLWIYWSYERDLFFKMLEILCRFQKLYKKFRKSPRFSKIIPFELVAWVSPNYEKTTCDGRPPCSKAVLRFQIRLRDMIHNSICLLLMEHYHKSAAVQTSAVFWNP